MEKEFCYLGRKFKIRHYFDPDVREERFDPKIGKSFEIVRGDIEGVEIFDSNGNLIGSFDYVDFNNDKAIINLIKKIIGDE